MKLKYKMLSLTVLAMTLVGCGGLDEKTGYTGPVNGSAVVQVDKQKTDSSRLNPSSAEADRSMFGEDKRFTEIGPDLLNERGYRASAPIQYNFGKLIVGSKIDGMRTQQLPQNDPNRLFIVPFNGWIRYPLAMTKSNQSKNRFPLIVFIHGHHSPEDPSYQGYDYLAKNLAENGYIVVSIDANKINSEQGGDSSSQSRAQLVLGTIDKLKQLDEFGGAGVLDELKGKIDFNRIGIMGHSRGGQAINLAIKFNSNRYGNDLDMLKQALKKNSEWFQKEYPDLILAKDDDQKLVQILNNKNINFSKTANSLQPYDFKAALSLAPTDFDDIKGLNNVPYATILPTCDGDLARLDGAKTYDYNRFSMQYDTAPKYQIVIRGANHNYFNSVWSYDDYIAGGAYGSIEMKMKRAIADPQNKDYCNEARPDSFRQAATDQQKIGLYVINSFMRYFVGNEQKFKAYWNGNAQLPQSTCAIEEKTCDRRVVMTIQNHDTRKIQRYELPNSLEINLLGAKTSFKGFKTNNSGIACKEYLGFFNTVSAQKKCTDSTTPLFASDSLDPLSMTGESTYSGGLISRPDQLHLIWDKANPSYSLGLNKLSTQSFDSLTFRVALPKEVGQEIIVELTDLKGNKARVNASDFTDALYTIPRDKFSGMPMIVHPDDAFYAGKTAELLNMIAIPLKAFKGVDTQYIDHLEFIFPKEKGGIALNDIQLQKLRN